MGGAERRDERETGEEREEICSGDEREGKERLNGSKKEERKVEVAT